MASSKEVRQCYLQCMMQRGALREREARDLYLRTCSVFDGKCVQYRIRSHTNSTQCNHNEHGIQSHIVERGNEVYTKVTNFTRNEC